MSALQLGDFTEVPVRLFGMTVLVGVAALCLAFAQDTPPKSDPGWVAPPNEAAKKNPQAGNPEAAATGKKLFLRHCAECHNEDGTGLQDASNLQSTEVQKQSDGALFWKITTGNVKKGMPPANRLSDDERWQVVSFLRTLKPGSE
jgi:mono/diheme cytochrome c family protein